MVIVGGRRKVDLTGDGYPGSKYVGCVIGKSVAHKPEIRHVADLGDLIDPMLPRKA